MTAEQLQAVTRDAAQAWLGQLIKAAPIEVAVVGDVDREAATRLVTRYLGALPARSRIGDKTLRERRAVTRPTGPIRVEETIDARTPQAVVFIGFFGADLKDTRDLRRLNIAARVIGASSEPAVVYPGFGLFVAVAPTDPGKAAALAAAVEDMYTAFAKDGPTAEELDVAKKQTANRLDETLKAPDFWSRYLATLDYRGSSLDDLLAARAQYEGLTAEEIRDAFARYDRPEARVRVVITPR